MLLVQLGEAKANPKSLVFAPRIDFPASWEGSPITRTRCDKPWDNVGFQAKWPSGRQGNEQPLPAGCHAAILQQRPPGGLASARSFENENLVSSDLLPYSFAPAI